MIDALKKVFIKKPRDIKELKIKKAYKPANIKELKKSLSHPDRHERLKKQTQLINHVVDCGIPKKKEHQHLSPEECTLEALALVAATQDADQSTDTFNDPVLVYEKQWAVWKFLKVSPDMQEWDERALPSMASHYALCRFNDLRHKARDLTKPYIQALSDMTNPKSWNNPSEKTVVSAVANIAAENFDISHALGNKRYDDKGSQPFFNALVVKSLLAGAIENNNIFANRGEEMFKKHTIDKMEVRLYKEKKDQFIPLASELRDEIYFLKLLEKGVTGQFTLDETVEYLNRSALHFEGTPLDYLIKFMARNLCQNADDVGKTKEVYRDGQTIDVPVNAFAENCFQIVGKIVENGLAVFGRKDEQPKDEQPQKKLDDTGKANMRLVS